VLELENWVMSCRVFGRRLDHEAMNIAVEAARERGATTIVAQYVPTAKNGVVSDLYAGLGFRRVRENAGQSDPSRWVLDLADYKPHATHILRRMQNHD
jgi:predicted enzyme involved in methoxymalonyl-ACP biosynthesis